MKIMKWARGVSAGLLIVIFCGCATVDETGRKQLRLVSAQEEMQMGLAAFDELKKQTPISRDTKANAMLQRVGTRIASIVTDMPEAQWEFVLFEDPEPNAFCLPGGKVGVNTGILPLTKDDAGLATVIGHEVAHASLHHGAERMSEALAMQLGGQLLGAAVGPKYQNAVALAYGAGATVGRELPHGRKQELEADRVGLRYMARAGYNPEAALAFWQRFSSATEGKGGSGPPAFLRTHPVSAERIKAIQQWLPEAKAQYRSR